MGGIRRWLGFPALAGALVATLVGGGTVPAGAATPDVGVHVSSTHEVLLGTPISDDELARWVPVVEQGDRVAFSRALTGSQAWAAHQVTVLYRDVLLREPDPEALRHWTALILAGGNVRDVAAHVLAGTFRTLP